MWTSKRNFYLEIKEAPHRIRSFGTFAFIFAFWSSLDAKAIQTILVFLMLILDSNHSSSH